MAKKVWIVCAMSGDVLYDDKTQQPAEFKTEAAAIKRAKEHVQEDADEEAWVFALSHIVSRPDVEPDVEAVK